MVDNTMKFDGIIIREEGNLIYLDFCLQNQIIFSVNQKMPNFIRGDTLRLIGINGELSYEMLANVC